MLKRFALLCGCLFGAHALAAGPNANIKHYGYDWLDFYETATPSFSATEALKAITGTGFSMTNLNVVHTLESLNLPVCAGGTCAVNIQAGSGAVSGSPFIDICPGAVSNSSCQAAGSWNAIWTVVKKIAGAKYKPGAIYFIDEPFDVPALQTGENMTLTNTPAMFAPCVRLCSSMGSQSPFTPFCPTDMPTTPNGSAKYSRARPRPRVRPM